LTKVIFRPQVKDKHLKFEKSLGNLNSLFPKKVKQTKLETQEPKFDIKSVQTNVGLVLSKENNQRTKIISLAKISKIPSRFQKHANILKS